jgi:hypothetical protein
LLNLRTINAVVFSQREQCGAANIGPRIGEHCAQLGGGRELAQSLPSRIGCDAIRLRGDDFLEGVDAACFSGLSDRLHRREADPCLGVLEGCEDECRQRIGPTGLASAMGGNADRLDPGVERALRLDAGQPVVRRTVRHSNAADGPDQPGFG